MIAFLGRALFCLNLKVLYKYRYNIGSEGIYLMYSTNTTILNVISLCRFITCV